MLLQGFWGQKDFLGNTLGHPHLQYFDLLRGAVSDGMKKLSGKMTFSSEACLVHSNYK